MCQVKESGKARIGIGPRAEHRLDQSASVSVSGKDGGSSPLDGLVDEHREQSVSFQAIDTTFELAHT